MNKARTFAKVAAIVLGFYGFLYVLYVVTG